LIARFKNSILSANYATREMKEIAIEIAIEIIKIEIIKIEVIL
jgi:hypothetical protein